MTPKWPTTGEGKIGHWMRRAENWLFFISMDLAAKFLTAKSEHLDQSKGFRAT